MLNLIMAVLWLIAGGTLLVWQRLHPEAARWDIRGTGISLGWFMIVLALYNLVRWWSRRWSSANRAIPRPAGTPSRRRKDTDTRERDPNFIFTDESADPSREP